MKTSPAGRAFVEREEGCVLHVYRDEVGIATAGVGHVLRPGDPIVITQDIADAWLAQDLGTVEACIDTALMGAANIGQNMFDALVSLGFNIGTGALQASSVMRCLKAGGYAAAADHFLDWNKVSRGGVLVVSANLAARRARERALFLTDVSTVADALQLPL